MSDTPAFVGERFHLDASGETFRTRIDARADAHGFFGIVPPNSTTSEVLLGEVPARELRNRLNEYLGDAPALTPADLELLRVIRVEMRQQPMLRVFPSKVPMAELLYRTLVDGRSP